MSDGPVAVLDNGGGTIKAGLAGDTKPTKVVPNFVSRAKSVRRKLVADEVDLCDDVQGLKLFRPVDRGYVVDWELQREIWDRVFSSILRIQPQGSRLLVTEPPFNFPTLRRAMEEIVFEDFGFQALCRPPASVMAHLHESPKAQADDARNVRPIPGCSLILDSGFSFTHVVPVWEDCALLPAIRRVNVGGKVLTNFLKEAVSYRAWNMMDEPYIMEDVKERLGFCRIGELRESLGFTRVPGAASPYWAEYLLPDGLSLRRGQVRDMVVASRALDAQRGVLLSQRHDQPAGMPAQQVKSVGAEDDEPRFREGATPVVGMTGGVKAKEELPWSAAAGVRRTTGTGLLAEQQVLTLGNERFMVPEALFHPSDIGIPQAGLAEAITASLEAVPPPLRRFFYASIIPVGGCTLFPFFKERLEMDLQPLVPSGVPLRVHHPREPITSAWCGASAFASADGFPEFCVTRNEYRECGPLTSERRLRRQTEFYIR